MGGGLLREVFAHGGSIVYRIKFLLTLPIACFRITKKKKYLY